MLRRLGLLFVALAVALPIYGSLAAQVASPQSFSPLDGVLLTATLSGDNEVPPVVTAASGFANMVVRPDEICYELNVTGLVATAAHIHTGAAGVNGGILVNLNTPNAEGLSSGCADVGTNDINAVLANPAGFYVNVHTGANPGGELRGQLTEVTVMAAQLNGFNEVSGDGDPYQGDIDGTGSAVLSFYPDQDTICFEFAFLNIATPTAGHIHRGGAGNNGPVEVNFTAGGGGVPAEGCVEDTNDVLGDIVADPASFYVNIHNADFPAGVIRGQVIQAPVLAASLRGRFEVPGPGDEDGEGLTTVVLNIADAEICRGVAVSDIDIPTAGHIHAGKAGESGPVVVDLNVPAGGQSSCVEATRDLMVDILTDPTSFYVNIHNAAFPGGAIRGQLYDQVPLNVTLNGANETDGAGNFDLGDPDGIGTGFFTINIVDLSVCYVLRVSGIAAATAAHIHEGDETQTGPVEVGLETPNAEGLSTDCAYGVDADVIVLLLANADDFYVNVHNEDFPAGAVRGQLDVTEDIPLGGAASSFRLTGPKNNVYLRDVSAPTPFTWTPSDGATIYTLTLFQLSSNARLGLIDTLAFAAADVCEGDVCSTDYDLSALETGTYSWTVTAGALEGQSVEASNAAFLFTLNVDPIELVRNGGFENPAAQPNSPNATAWKRVNPSGERRSCDATKLPANVNGACAYLGTGGAPASLVQNVPAETLKRLNIAANDTLTVTASVQANAAVLPARSKVQVQLQYQGGKRQTINVPLDSAAGAVFAPITPKSTTLGANRPRVTKATVRIISASKFAIDDISVILEPVGAPAPALPAGVPLPAAPGGDLRGQ